MGELRVRALRFWYGLRERIGLPLRLTPTEFETASPTVLLSGSPWVKFYTASSATSSENYHWTTSTNWPSD